MDLTEPTISNLFYLTRDSVKVEFTKDVYSNNSDTGDLEPNDFNIYLGNYKLNPSSVEKNDQDQSKWKLAFNAHENLDGTEVLTVTPKAYSIFSKNGIAASTSQSNNKVLYANSPIIKSVSIDNQDGINVEAIVQFSEEVYTDDVGFGDLEISDFELSIVGGNATFLSLIHI